MIQPTAYPSWIQIETCTTCTARCITCPSRMLAGVRPQLMPDNLLEKLLQDMAYNASFIQTVVPFNSGEPLCDPRIFDILAQIRDRIGKGKVLFSTNASLLQGEKADKLRSFVMDQTIQLLSFSVDGYQSFDQVRVGLQREVIYANILRFVQTLPDRSKVNIHMTVCPENMYDLEQFVSYWTSEGIPTSFMPCDGRIGHGLSKPSPLPCQRILWSNVYILTNGVATPCCVDWSGLYHLGDLSTQTVSEIWHGKPYEYIRSAHLRCAKDAVELCRDCQAWY